MKTLNLIIVPQEYEIANHKNLWLELSNKLEGNTLIINIPADQLITRIKKKKYRLDEAKKGIININSNLSILRPKFILRPEVAPRVFNSVIRNEFMKQLKMSYPDIDKYNVNIICYGGKWIDILSGCNNINLYYYILDEVKYYAHSSEKNEIAIKYDLIGCKNSKYVFTMSDDILKERESYNKNIMVIGNGASYVGNSSIKVNKVNKSVAFIGNFRSWIDLELLEGLVKDRTDINFAIVGPIQDDMKNIFIELLNNNHNLMYMGCAKKQDINYYYHMFDVVIVPYKQNEFMKATRPIKIVESIFAGTPVVTVPISGYKEDSFIRFATTISSFSSEIDYLFNNPINVESNEYKSFIKENSWKSIAVKIASVINSTCERI